jgi:hypothetical protein
MFEFEAAKFAKKRECLSTFRVVHNDLWDANFMLLLQTKHQFYQSILTTGELNFLLANFLEGHLLDFVVVNYKL